MVDLRTGFVIAVALFPLAGCGKTETVTTYTVAKPPPAVRPASVGPGMMSPPLPEAASNEPGRMLGAIVPHGEKTWFFKLTGPSDSVVQLATQFLEFIRSLRFEGDVPRWDRPEGWTEKPGNEFRFATLVIESATGPLELTVSPLPTGKEDFQDQLLANVNRWRGQMHVAPLDVAQLKKATLELDVNDLKVWLVNIEGKLGGTGMGRGGMGGHPPTGRPVGGAGVAEAGRPSSLPDLPFRFQLPEGWTRKPAGPMRVAEFLVSDGDKTITISVSVAGGDRLANVNRWRGQIGMDPIEEAALRESLRQIAVCNLTGEYVELVGPKTDKPAQAILGVIAPAGDRQWFFKLQGDAELARREQGRFEEFVKSVQFRDAAEDKYGQ